MVRNDFIEWTNGVWNFNGESKNRVGHPAPFPVELPRRCIKLFSYVGDAVLADSGRVVTIGATGSGSPPIGSYIPATPRATEGSGRTVNVRIRPGVWNWNTYNVIDSEESGINGGAFPPQT